MKNFDLGAFKAGKIAVSCRTEEAARDFLKEAERRGIVWFDGEKATEFNDFYICGKNSTYDCTCDKLCVGPVSRSKISVIEWIPEKTEAQSAKHDDAEKHEDCKISWKAWQEYHDEENGTAAKHDAGKPRLTLVPPQIIFDIAEVREYGLKKYGDPENWKQVDRQRYVDAMYRHWLEFLKDPLSVDEESGIAHYKHVACNMAFISEMMAEVIKREKETC